MNQQNQDGFAFTPKTAIKMRRLSILLPPFMICCLEPIEELKTQSIHNPDRYQNEWLRLRSPIFRTLYGGSGIRSAVDAAGRQCSRWHTSQCLQRASIALDLADCMVNPWGFHPNPASLAAICHFSTGSLAEW